MDPIHRNKSDNKIEVYMKFGFVQTLSSLHNFEKGDIISKQACLVVRLSSDMDKSVNLSINHILPPDIFYNLFGSDCHALLWMCQKL